jgi:hypothetical protein
MITNKASTSQRLVAYLIDIFVIGVVVSLITDLVYYIARLDFSTIDVLTEQMLLQAQKIMEILESNGNATDQIVILQQYSIEIMKLYAIQLACTGAVSLVVFILYMVVLPLKWSKQTIGRAVMKCKVIYPNVNDLNEDALKKKTVKAFFIRELVAGWLLYYMIGSLIVIIIALVYYKTRKRTLADAIYKTETVSCIEVTYVTPQENFEQPKQEEPNDPFKIDPKDYEVSSEKTNKDDDYVIF